MYGNDHAVFIFRVFTQWLTFDSLYLLSHPCISGIDVLLGLGCMYFLENFCVCVSKENWSVIFILCWVFV